LVKKLLISDVLRNDWVSDEATLCSMPDGLSDDACASAKKAFDFSLAVS